MGQDCGGSHGRCLMAMRQRRAVADIVRMVECNAASACASGEDRVAAIVGPLVTEENLFVG